MIKNFKELIVWQKAFSLTKSVYEFTENFPRSEEYGLKSQMRRCAVSIVSNIAEGYARSTRKDYAHFLSNSLGSCAELETQILLSKEFNFLNEEQVKKLLTNLEEVGKMLTVIRKKLLNPLGVKV
ncbi:four helix bundle protein [Candidatus Gracilibacteria bacterium]|nr:four helix bundle protein [Candidatus Gracilibacteria bacterium]MCF7856133.1 four helix bundle protein [Candidatus Gracilibacteria bacterium]MCF7896599.1 four helix bundle protein [Candidatus Gracilibacteria bacterium]